MAAFESTATATRQPLGGIFARADTLDGGSRLKKQ